jgi:hypothetical protein
MSSFAPKVAFLPEAQRALWPLLSQVPSGFVLYGGTALALRLGHRRSVDFDFFASRSFEPEALRAAIPFLEGVVVALSEPDTLTAWVQPLPGGSPVHVSFFGGIGLPVIDRPDRADPDGIVIASLRDLAGTKAKVINERVELKDYLDIAALLDAGMTLPEIVAAAVAIFPGQVDEIATVSAITFFEDGEVATFPEPLKRKLRAAARGASRVPPPVPTFESIEASAAAVGR